MPASNSITFDIARAPLCCVVGCHRKAAAASMLCRPCHNFLRDCGLLNTAPGTWDRPVSNPVLGSFDFTKAPLCCVEGCYRKARSRNRGVCWACRMEHTKAGVPLPPKKDMSKPLTVCETPDCGRTSDKYIFKGPFCHKCFKRNLYYRKKATGDLCVVDGCSLPSNSQELCTRHHQRAIKHDALEYVNDPNRSIEDRFNDYVIRGETPDDCWGWSGHTNNSYAILWVNGKIERAHRISYGLHKRPIPEGMFVLHKCPLVNGKRPNKFCTNPNHLDIGTAAENSQDDDVGKLNAEQVHVIRALLAIGKYGHSQIGAAFGVTGDHIRRINAGDSWYSLAEASPETGLLQQYVDTIKEIPADGETLTPEQVQVVRELLARKCFTQPQIALAFNVSANAVGDIKTGARWGGLAVEAADPALVDQYIAFIEPPPPPGSVTPEQVQVIRALVAEGRFMHKDIASLFGIDRSSVGQIKSGKAWRKLPVEAPDQKLLHDCITLLEA